MRVDWNDALPASACSYVMGNPPFVGAKYQSSEQRADFESVAGDIHNSGLLDFVSAWHIKASDYITATDDITTEVAFVSTNSITQGEQVGVLWSELLKRGMHIRFAYRTFSWVSEARGAAHVHVVIIGFRRSNAGPKTIIEVLDDGQLSRVDAKNINPYLIDAPNLVILNRSKPLCDVPTIGIGNKPIDDGNYLFNDEEKAEFIAAEPASAPLFRKWYGSAEFINGWHRWCLWLGGVPANELRKMPRAMKRVEAVRAYRAASQSAPTRAIADTPTRFHVEYMPSLPFLVIPEVSSERRPYIPIGFMTPDVLCSNKLRIFSEATRFHFGLLSSAMHMAWVRVVTGRLKSDFQWSVKLVYNNYPWPTDANDAQKQAVETAAQGVLDARSGFPTQTLADLYDPLAMPKELRDAHRALDRAVDRCYRPQPFDSDRHRVEYLFGLYEKLTTLFPLTKAMRRPRR